MSSLGPTLTEQLETLQKRYGEFRSHAKPRERFPEGLRVATLDLIDSGVPQSIVEATCKVQGQQIARWRDRHSSLDPVSVARVLKVVDTAAGATSGAAKITIEGGRIIIDLVFEPE